MEPITLCGAVIVAFGIWVEFEAVFSKVARAVTSGVMSALTPSEKMHRSVRYVSSSGCRSYRAGSNPPYRMARG